MAISYELFFFSSFQCQLKVGLFKCFYFILVDAAKLFLNVWRDGSAVAFFFHYYQSCLTEFLVKSNRIDGFKAVKGERGLLVG